MAPPERWVSGGPDVLKVPAHVPCLPEAATLTAVLPRCPFKGDSYRTQVVALDRAALPFWSHYQRFTVATFTLLDSVAQRALRGQVGKACAPCVWLMLSGDKELAARFSQHSAS